MPKEEWKCSVFQDAGYRIIGLPVAGFDRKHLWKNFSVLLKLIRSQWKARSIIKEFRPQVAVGVGGYASGPTLKMAGMMGIPTLIQEQNSYAGVTNKLLAQKACKICVAYEGMEKFFPAEKIIMTGNPVRQNLLGHSILHADAVKYFGLNPEKKTILILGRQSWSAYHQPDIDCRTGCHSYPPRRTVYLADWQDIH